MLSANRSLTGLASTAWMTNNERNKAEDLVKQACVKLDSETTGNY